MDSKANTHKFDFVKTSRYTIPFSIAITILALLLIVFRGLNLGIDFTGGILIELRASKDISSLTLRQSLAKVGYNNAIIQTTSSEHDFLLKIQPKNGNEVQDIQTHLTNDLSPATIEFRSVSFIGPKIGGQLIWDGVKASIAALIVMLTYIWFRFDLQFGIGAVIALLHDTISVLGFYSITQFEFDLSSIAAVLTIIGYSINNTVVIYDRIRENLRKFKRKQVIELVNLSVNETLSRTIMTSITTLVVCISLVLLGGQVLKAFSATLLFGIAFGTYSSVFISAPILRYINTKKLT